MPRKKAGQPALSTKAATVTTAVKPPIDNRQQLISVRGEQIRKGELTVEAFAKELKLTDLQLSFCLEYMKPESMGSHVQAYAKAAGLDLNIKEDAQIARVAGLKLADHVGCMTLINSMLDADGFNMDNAKRQLSFLMLQNSDKKTKLAATKLFCEITGKLANHTEITVKHQYDFNSLSPDKLEKLIEWVEEVEIKSHQQHSPDYNRLIKGDFITDIEVEQEKTEPENKILKTDLPTLPNPPLEPVSEIENPEETEFENDDDDPCWPDED
jgi:hypothetical protein